VLQAADLLTVRGRAPPARRSLVLCNPPWLPARPVARWSMRCTTKAAACCAASWRAWPRTWRPGGEGWLILSDLAEHLGLRKRDELLGWIADAGLKVSGRTDMRPRHPKAADANDALHAARAAEVTSLWRLTVT
jgi:hypothetical protein